MLLVLLAACGGNTSRDESGSDASQPVKPGADAAADAGQCAARQSGGNLTADCERYCSVYSDCVVCPSTVASACESICLAHGGPQLECLDCAVAHIHQVVNALTCHDFTADFGVFTITYPISDCGDACQL